MENAIITDVTTKRITKPRQPDEDPFCDVLLTCLFILFPVVIVSLLIGEGSGYLKYSDSALNIDRILGITTSGSKNGNTGYFNSTSSGKSCNKELKLSYSKSITIFLVNTSGVSKAAELIAF